MYYIYIYGPHLYHFCSGFDSEILLDRMCSSKKCSSFWFLCTASERGDNCRVWWPSDPNSIKLPWTWKDWSAQNYQTNVFSSRGNLRSFCRFLRSFCGLQFVRLRPKNKKWTFLAWATLVESRLAQIVLQGPCTMQNWKKNMRFLKICPFGMFYEFVIVFRNVERIATDEATGIHTHDDRWTLDTLL